jgi:hypothetical protein
MEGKFASEGLQASDGDDDRLAAIARALVENRGIDDRPIFSGNIDDSYGLPDRRSRRNKFQRANQRICSATTADTFSHSPLD